MRYAGQSYELNIPFSQTLTQDFSLTHQNVYGYHRDNTKTEIVNVRVRAVGLTDKPHISQFLVISDDPSSAFLESRDVDMAEGKRRIPFYQGETLQPGNKIQGPAIIVHSDTTILLNEHNFAEVDTALNILIRVENTEF